MNTPSQSLSLDIRGMHCGNCVAKVARALTAVESVDVQKLAIGRADLRFDPSKTSEQEILAGLERAGYPASRAGG